MNILHISLIQDFKVQHNLRIYSDSKNLFWIRIPYWLILEELGMEEVN